MAGTRRKPGLLGPYVAGYSAWLINRGHTALTTRNMLKEFSQLGRWLAEEHLEVQQLSEERLAVFLAARRRAGYRRLPGLRGLRPPLAYLREVGAVGPATAPITALDELLVQYRDWLVVDRGLAPATVLRYVNTARRFLGECTTAGVKPSDLTGREVNAFLIAECGRVSAGSAKGRVAELRSLLRYLFARKIIAVHLGTAVPPVGGWRLATVPPRMTAAEVQTLLDHCDRTTDVGVRNFAILILVARLGLRSIEVARLELGDLDWRAGELVVRGKGGRVGRLPLPTDVGEALVDHLRRRRAAAGCRHVFVTLKAPHGPIRADLVNDVTKQSCRRAGLARVGPHRLRHALAAELLRRGAGLTAIGQVLRHQDVATTALYAKVDLTTLRRVAQPWPTAATR
jgi:site-specific recombinase XerD